MTIRAFVGGAGCGKTYQLMAALKDQIEKFPLQDGQKVLALTYMHGSRIRLHERLESIPCIKRKFECITLDSFAWRLVRRWRSLASDLGFSGISPSDFSKIVAAASAILESGAVGRWVSAAYPILLVDEAQDLNTDRIRILTALSVNTRILAAADEFQCLDETLRPSPAMDWLQQSNGIKVLEGNRRTNVSELLNAAAAIREGRPPASNKAFKIVLAPKPIYAGNFLTYALEDSRKKGTAAIICPQRAPYVTKVIGWTDQNKTAKGVGPFHVIWDQSGSEKAENFIGQIDLPEISTSAQAIERVRSVGNHRVLSDITSWINIQRRALGRDAFTSIEISEAIKRSFTNKQRSTYSPANVKFRAMTVHGAKNREFNHVIVLWPAGVRGSDDQLRRLLYNAVTRAKEKCLVLVQTKASMNKPPFC